MWFFLKIRINLFTIRLKLTDAREIKWSYKHYKRWHFVFVILID